ncbi:hypothetical protein CS0771_61270 [Catellatospora sp. IY07-71]|uniref:hypothetical protein n=1 Tax=Catellatospora sp. IY07-71 TaxID=2728827 RepID=UPI001BB43C6E|nr:hypothetical protein [Catellatospora sp. IY07-71]BCJ76583.1 hypothetical protein CS0771_61270 [Catellatospora sp. IY07-71]
MNGSTRDWASLSAQERAEAVALAAQGRPFPDPAVAAAIVDRVRRLDRRDQNTRELLLGVAMTAFYGLCLAMFIAGGSVQDVPGWILLLVLPVAPGFVIMNGEYTPRVFRGGLPPHAQTPNLLLLLHRAGPLPAVPLTIPRRRGLRAWWPLLVPAVAAVGWLTWYHLGVPADLVEGLSSFGVSALVWLVLLLVVAAGALTRRLRGVPRDDPAPGAPITLDADGLRPRGWREPVPWSEVYAVELVGPTPEQPDSPLAVRWSVRGRDPITVPAGDMALPPETAVRATWAYRPGLAAGQREEAP